MKTRILTAIPAVMTYAGGIAEVIAGGFFHAHLYSWEAIVWGLVPMFWVEVARLAERTAHNWEIAANRYKSLYYSASYEDGYRYY